MRATDIIGWTYEGAIYCTDHDHEPTQPPESLDYPNPVFGSDVNECLGDVCDVCREPIVD
jgi:hypothetical protein